ncbi:Hypothetical predicted protein [Mytilus galloprovincialis]|uniref:Uncharacterized protein n=1 Tax=Mytilus galloprovincialis TaxID=29158 RepID=A0A8B6BUS6_MYTGA|nr:Hypothetical predicted protein [Mytilus galloprovincialis]
MCHLIVGTEDHVKQLRLLHAVRNDLSKRDDQICITSGSFGEGLDMRGSDLDIMCVYRDKEVYDVKPCLNQHKSYLSMDTEDVKPGFTQLRLDYCVDQILFENCEQFANKFYLSSTIWKPRIPLNEKIIIHGPCFSDRHGYSDIAICLHCKTWVFAARHWITRSNNSWPGYDVKQSIMRHGVLFVPIGVKGSPNEDLEWRI